MSRDGEDAGRGRPTAPSVLSIHIDDLPLTVRAYNCLSTIGITRVGELVRQDRERLLAVRNMGRTSVKDVERVLAELGLRLGMQDVDVTDALRIADADQVQEVQGFVSALVLLRNGGVGDVDALVHAAPDDLLKVPGVDRGVLEIVESGLRKWGLALGRRRADGGAGGDSDDTEAQGEHVAYENVRAELQDAVIRALEPKDGWARCFIAYHGLSGAPRRTLQEIGDDGTEYGFGWAVTRERVRQVVAVAERKLRRKSSHVSVTMWQSAIEVAARELPASPGRVVASFGYEAASDSEAYEMLKFCSGVFGLDFPFKIRAMNGLGRLVVGRGDDTITTQRLTALKSEIDGEAYAEVSGVAKNIGCEEELLRKVVGACDRLEFIDDGQRYFWKRPVLPPQNFGITGNRVLTNLCKVFSVTERANSSDLSTSIPRGQRGVRSLDMPIVVLEGIAERSGLFDVVQGEVRRKSQASWCSIGSRDLALLAICVKHGRVIPSKVIYEGLVREGLTKENAAATVAYSPFLVHARAGVGDIPGVYKFVPRPEDIDLDELRTRVFPGGDADREEAGDEQGSVRLAVPISGRTRLSGRHLVADAMGLAGEWQVRDEAAVDVGRITVSERLVSGLVPLIAKLELEDGDLLELRRVDDGVLAARRI